MADVISPAVKGTMLEGAVRAARALGGKVTERDDEHGTATVKVQTLDGPAWYTVQVRKARHGKR